MDNFPPLPNTAAAPEDHPAEIDPPASPPNESSRMCRLCFGGEEDEPELGRLFSPCKCRGTARFIHVKCLEEWRQKSAQRKSYYQCDQCYFQYKLSRLSFAALLRDQVLLSVVTLLLFILLTFICGMIAKYTVASWLLEELMESEEEPENPEQPKETPVGHSHVLDEYPFYHPIHLMNGGLLLGLLSYAHFALFTLPGQLGGDVMLRFYGGGGRRRGERPALGAWLVILAGIGAVRALYLLYTAVRSRVRDYGLLTMERFVLDIREDPEVTGEQKVEGSADKKDQ